MSPCPCPGVMIRLTFWKVHDHWMTSHSDQAFPQRPGVAWPLRTVSKGGGDLPPDPLRGDRPAPGRSDRRLGSHLTKKHLEHVVKMNLVHHPFPKKYIHKGRAREVKRLFLKRKELLPFVTAWVDIMLSEISPSEKDKHRMVSLTCGI